MEREEFTVVKGVRQDKGAFHLPIHLICAQNMLYKQQQQQQQTRKGSKERGVKIGGRHSS